MTNVLVGDVYAKIIEEVINSSTTDFEESGVSQSTLQELQREWQNKLSQRNVAHMPWEPKQTQPAPTAQPSAPTPTSNGLPPSSYTNYDNPASATATNGARVKPEPAGDSQYGGLANGTPQDNGPAQGGLARAQHLLQQQYGPNASASLNAMQRAGGGGGLALPGQPQNPAKPQGLHLPGQASPPTQPQYSPQQQQAIARQQQQFQQQQDPPRVKLENESPQLAQGGFAQEPTQPNYSQTDGADDAYEQWQELLAQRRAVSVEQRQEADRLVRERVMQHSSELQSGLMMPFDEQPSKRKRKLHKTTRVSDAAGPSARAIPQLDGDLDDEDEKPDIKDEDDADAINSDLDDSDDDGQGPMGDDDDEYGDQILCTYDKVQRVKNKWKCVLKDGVMSANGKEWVFHKGTGEFEW